MRGLNRNKRQLYYALKVDETTDKDEYGNETGEVTPVYGDAVALDVNISAATGEDAVQAFGNFTGYSRTMFVADTACLIDEDSIIWFGIEPSKPHNYIVVRRADSKNGIMFALQEVTVE